MLSCSRHTHYSMRITNIHLLIIDGTRARARAVPIPRLLRASDDDAQMPRMRAFV